MTYKLNDAKWKYITFATAWCPDSTAVASADTEVVALQKTWVEMLTRVAKTRCLVCEGWGHSMKKCPTQARLTTMSAGYGLFRTIRNQTHEAIQRDNNQTSLGITHPGNLPHYGGGFSNKPKLF